MGSGSVSLTPFSLLALPQTCSVHLLTLFPLSSCHYLPAQALLQQLISQKKLTSKSRFKDGRALFATSDEYLDLLGHPGSTPLELFQDAIDDLEVKLEALTVDARDAYEKAGNPFVDATTRAEFDAVVGEKVEEGVRGEVFDFVSRRPSLCIPCLYCLWATDASLLSLHLLSLCR